MGDVQKGEYIYMDFVKALKKSKCKLEHLSLKGYNAEPEVMIAISKIKSLKTLRISEARRVVLTPEIVNSFAQNENQLETLNLTIPMVSIMILILMRIVMMKPNK